MTIHNAEPTDDAKRREFEAEFLAALLVLFRQVYEDNEPRTEAEAMLLPVTLSAQLLSAGPILRHWLYRAAALGIETGIDEYGDAAYVDVESAAGKVASDRLQTLLPQLQQSTLSKARAALFSAVERGLALSALYASVGGLFSLNRAQTIATTEITFAFNTGLYRLGGLLTGVNAQQWVSRQDDRVCPICSALSGSIWIDGQPAEGAEYSFGEPIRLGAPFVHPGGTGAQTQYAGRTFQRPPAHVNCRCRLRLLRI